MGVTYVFRLDLSGEFSWRLEHQAIIKHLYLYLRSLDVIGSMTAGIDRHLLNNEFGIVSSGNELSMLSQEGVFPNLGLDEFYCFSDLVQDSAFKSNVLDDVHLRSDLFFDSFVLDETGTRSWEELLRIFAEEQNASRTDSLLPFLVDGYKTIILA